MNTITKSDFLQMVKLDHLEVLTQEQLGRNTQILKTYMEKALTSDLSDVEKSDSNAMIDDISSLQQWCVLRDDFSKAIVYTRREQIAWDEPERGEFGEILKARGGVYKPTGENKKLGRVGQKYGEANSNETDAIKHRTMKEQAKEWPKKYKQGEESKEEKEDVKGLREHSAKIGEKIEEIKKIDKVLEHYREATKGQREKLTSGEVDKLRGFVNFSRKPYDLEDVEETKVTPGVKELISKIPVISSDKDFLRNNCPKEAGGNLYIAEVMGTRFLVDP